MAIYVGQAEEQHGEAAVEIKTRVTILSQTIMAMEKRATMKIGAAGIAVEIEIWDACQTYMGKNHKKMQCVLKIA